MGFNHDHKGLFNAAIPLVAENGHYDVLESEILAIQRYFQDVQDDLGVSPEDRSNIIGHCGLGGEFANGIGHAIKNSIRHLEPVLVQQKHTEILTENAGLICKAFNHIAKKYYNDQSQRAKFSEDEITAMETAGPALQRSLGEIRGWVTESLDKTASLPDGRRGFVERRLEQIAASVEKCDAAVQEVESLAQTTTIYAAAYQIELESMKREDIRAFFKLSKTIAQKFDA